MAWPSAAVCRALVNMINALGDSLASLECTSCTNCPPILGDVVMHLGVFNKPNSKDARWRPSLLGWRPSQVGWRPSLLGARSYYVEAIAIKLEAIATIRSKKLLGL